MYLIQATLILDHPHEIFYLILRHPYLFITEQVSVSRLAERHELFTHLQASLNDNKQCYYYPPTSFISLHDNGIVSISMQLYVYESNQHELFEVKQLFFPRPSQTEEFWAEFKLNLTQVSVELSHLVSILFVRFIQLLSFNLNRLTIHLLI